MCKMKLEVQPHWQAMKTYHLFFKKKKKIQLLGSLDMFSNVLWYLTRHLIPCYCLVVVVYKVMKQFFLQPALDSMPWYSDS